jgi:hypothetical protein
LRLDEQARFFRGLCNVIKSAREYGMFVVLFGEFLEMNGEEYRAANPDHFPTIGAMSRRFNDWLYGLRHEQEVEAETERA